MIIKIVWLPSYPYSEISIKLLYSLHVKIPAIYSYLTTFMIFIFC